MFGFFSFYLVEEDAFDHSLILQILVIKRLVAIFLDPLRSQVELLSFFDDKILLVGNRVFYV